MEAIDNKIEWFDDYDLLKTFYITKVHIFTKTDRQGIIIQLPKIKDFLDKDYISYVFNLFRQSMQDILKSFDYWAPQTYFQFFQILFFELQDVIEFVSMHQHLTNFINFIFQENEVRIDQNNHTIFINDYRLDESLWDYIWYILWISFGEKRSRPQFFHTQTEREYFKQMQETEERIKQIRSRGTHVTKNNQNSINQLLVMFSVIMYSFKQITFDFLFNCTNAQINWLYEYAQRISSYEVESKIFASGNSKKKKLKFFTEK